MTKLKPLDIPKTSQADKVKLITDFLNDNYEIRINCFDPSKSEIKSKSKKYEYSVTVTDISLHMISEGVPHSDTLLRKILTSPNQIKTYNPIVEYFESLRGKFKGKMQIDILCDHLKAKDFGDQPDGYYQNRLRYYVKKWFVAAAAQVLQGKANDMSLGFIHTEEGIGKTYLAEFLTPTALKDFFCKSDRNEKVFNLTESFARNFIVLFDEFEGISNRTIDAYKKTMSSAEITVKLPREAFPINQRRLASSIFTSNRNQEIGGFLQPSYGYRRFASIELELINQQYSKIIDVDQLWAEAVMLLSQSFDFVWNSNDFEELKEYNRRYLIVSAAANIVSTWYEVPQVEEEGEWKQASEILNDLRKAKKLTGDYMKLSAEKIGMGLTALGFTKEGRKRKDFAGSRYMYLVKPLYTFLIYMYINNIYF